MKKKSLTLILCLCFIALACGSASAADIPSERQLPLLVDEADLLSDSQESGLLDRLESVSAEHQCEVAIVTTADTGGKTTEAYADDFYDYNGYGWGVNDDGLLLVIDMENRYIHISTYGFGITALTDAGIDYILDEIAPYLYDGDFYSAMDSFIAMTDGFLKTAREGAAYDVGNMPPEPTKEKLTLGEAFKLQLSSLPIFIIVGLVIGLIVVLIMRGRNKSARFKNSAADYVRPGSFAVTGSDERFIGSSVNRVRKQQQSSGGSSTHVSSSGRSHGGGGRGF